MSLGHPVSLRKQILPVWEQPPDSLAGQWEEDQSLYFFSPWSCSVSEVESDISCWQQLHVVHVPSCQQYFFPKPDRFLKQLCKVVILCRLVYFPKNVVWKRETQALLTLYCLTVKVVIMFYATFFCCLCSHWDHNYELQKIQIKCEPGLRKGPYNSTEPWNS